MPCINEPFTYVHNHPVNEPFDLEVNVPLIEKSQVHALNVSPFESHSLPLRWCDSPHRPPRAQIDACDNLPIASFPLPFVFSFCGFTLIGKGKYVLVMVPDQTNVL